MRVVDHDRERLPLVHGLESPRNVRDTCDARRHGIFVEVEQQCRSDGAEHVLDVEATAEARLDLDSRGPEPASARRKLETLGANLGRGVHSERDERSAVDTGELCCEPAPPVVAHVHGGRRRLRAGEQASLRLEVVLHRPMEIEVVLAQIGEDERVEPDSVESSERRTV